MRLRQLNQAIESVQFLGIEFSKPFLYLDFPSMISQRKRQSDLLFQFDATIAVENVTKIPTSFLKLNVGLPQSLAS